ncbi:MAG: hypothetical protein ACRCTP_04405 [Aeromonas popoffii]|uniref:hypothetical protein n=1 Tax=Aeromonas popoffii TaxID=70856 RepID=UPI003F2DD031
MTTETTELEKSLDVQLPSSAVDRDKLDIGIKHIKDALLRMDSERDFIKQTVDGLHEQFPDIPKDFFKKTATDLHKSAFGTRVAKEDSYREFYQAFTTIVAKTASK